MHEQYATYTTEGKLLIYEQESTVTCNVGSEN